MKWKHLKKKLASAQVTVVCWFVALYDIWRRGSILKLSGTVFTVTTYVFSIYIYAIHIIYFFHIFAVWAWSLDGPPLPNDTRTSGRRQTVWESSNNASVTRAVFHWVWWKHDLMNQLHLNHQARGKAEDEGTISFKTWTTLVYRVPSAGNTCKPGVIKIWRDIFHPVTKRKIINPKPSRNYFQHSTENCSMTKSTQYLSYLTTSVWETKRT